MTEARDHGGNLDEAIQRFGGDPRDWLDLSTGINPDPYPLPAIPPEHWAILPRKPDMQNLHHAAATAYGTPARVIPTHGAQGAIQIVPWLRPAGRAAVLAPTYNEHASALLSAGWQVAEVATFEDLSGADLAVVVNPNNPDGRRWPPAELRQLSQNVDLLIVDESFADPEPEVSSAAQLSEPNIIVLRSFGKFYGLAGVRLGFALCNGELADRMADLAGPWPVSGPAIEIARHALLDREWQTTTTASLKGNAQRLDGLADRVGWRLVGGTPLFRTYETGDAAAAQNGLAQHHIWSRIFPYSSGWIRLGLPPQKRWPQLENAFASLAMDTNASGLSTT